VLPLDVSAEVVHDGATQEVSTEHDVAVSVGDRLVVRFLQGKGGPTYVVDGLPRTASTTTKNDVVEVGWSPTEEDIGSHDVHIVARDGAVSEDHPLRVLVEQSGHTWLTPGAVASVFIPEDVGRLGWFAGGGAELVLYSFVDRGPGPFGLPSHGRFYVDLEVLAAMTCSAAGAAMVHPCLDPIVFCRLGFDVTFERDPRRRFLIPFAGAEIGFAAHKQLGGFGFGMPLAGVYAWASSTVRIALSGGYLLPTTAAQDTRGVRVAAALDIGW